jgi:hypothetical protein
MTDRTPSPVRVRHRAIPWWLPLIVPALVTFVYAVGTISQKPHVVGRPAFAPVMFGWLIILVLLAIPAFISGLLYAWQHGAVNEVRPKSA